MNKILTIIIFSFLVGCSATPNKKLIGKWKSNQEKTLASALSTKGVSEKAKQAFKKDFFGKLVIEYKEKTYRSWYKNKENTKDPESYKVLEKTNQYHIVESTDSLSDNTISTKLFWEGECYYQIVSTWNFREYFCKIE